VAIDVSVYSHLCGGSALIAKYVGIVTRHRTNMKTNQRTYSSLNIVKTARRCTTKTNEMLLKICFAIWASSYVAEFLGVKCPLTRFTGAPTREEQFGGSEDAGLPILIIKSF
jgi:hypothetical protein